MHAITNRALFLFGTIGLLLASQAFARTVELTLTAKEVTLPVNGKIIGGSDTMAAWTFDGTIPGPVLRMNEGDTVDFTLINAKTNTHPHSIDLHAAQVSVLDEFAMIMPGERVRIYFVNANVNLPVSLHPIAGIWDRVYLNGNPKNVQYGMQTVAIPVASAPTFDIVMPKNGKKVDAVAILDHSMDAALRGAITILEAKEDDPKKGHGELILK